MKTTLIRLLFSLLLSTFLVGCTTYKLEVQQGNALSSEQVAKLKKGMSKAEVTSILGTPLLQDSFQTHRWDYTFYINKKGKTRERKDLVLIFSNDRLVSIKHK